MENLFHSLLKPGYQKIIMLLMTSQTQQINQASAWVMQFLFGLDAETTCIDSGWLWAAEQCKTLLNYTLSVSE